MFLSPALALSGIWTCQRKDGPGPSGARSTNEDPRRLLPSLWSDADMIMETLLYTMMYALYSHYRFSVLDGDDEIAVVDPSYMAGDRPVQCYWYKR